MENFCVYKEQAINKERIESEVNRMISEGWKVKQLSSTCYSDGIPMLIVSAVYEKDESNDVEYLNVAKLLMKD